MGWFCFICTLIGAGILIWMQSYTHKNLTAMRDRQIENERRLWEDMRRRDFRERAMLGQADDRARNSRNKQNKIVEVKKGGRVRRYSINKYGEVFELD